jgi:hypothetical protein
MSEKKCENCIHFEVCCYVSHQLPVCDSYAEAPVQCKDCYNMEKTDRDRFIRCVQLGIEVPDIFFCRYGDREG